MATATTLLLRASDKDMNLSSVVDTIDILNLDKKISNPSSNALILTNEANKNKSHYIVSDADAELLILIKFKQNVVCFHR